MDIGLFYYDPEELCKSRRILTPRLLDRHNASENTQPHLIIAIYFTATMVGQVVLFLSNRFVPVWKQVLRGLGWGRESFNLLVGHPLSGSRTSSMLDIELT